MKHAADFARTAGELKFSAQALEMWNGGYRALTSEFEGLIGAVTSRAEAQVRRLAAIYALMQTSDRIRTRHLAAALALWDYCFASAKFIFNGRSVSNLEDKLLSMLKSSRSGITRTQISDALQRHATSDAIDRALFALSEKGRANMQTEQSRGRPIKRWFYVARGKD
jgi:hypothetical protein